LLVVQSSETCLTLLLDPDYYNERRPQPQGLPATLSYGGDSFDITLGKDDVGDDSSILSVTKVVLVRPGFSTHSINFSQRYVRG
jgi:hypothetical protein